MVSRMGGRNVIEIAYGHLMKRFLSQIPDVRNELFGFSIISVILFHFCEDVCSAKLGGAAETAATVYNSVIGSNGVEIFLFLSGMGLFYSLSSDSNIRSFYRKRLLRILPVYLLLGSVGWLVLDILIRQKGILSFLYDFSTLSFWTEGVRTVWYISFILIMYLLFPLIYRLIAIPSKRLAGAAVTALLTVWIAVCMSLSFLVPDVYNNIEIALWRVVPFVIGAWYGISFRRGESVAAQSVILCALGAVFVAVYHAAGYDPGFLWGVFRLRFANLFYPYVVLFAATAVLVLCGGSRFLRSVGAASLELYLSHVIIRVIMKELGLPTCYPLNYLLCTALSVALSYAVHRLIKCLQNKRKN